jgi:DNA-binding transcriptional MerR regulator
MSDLIVTEQTAVTAVQVTVTANAVYSLETAAELTDVHSDLLRKYCELGLLGDERSTAGIELTFDDEALYEVRRIEYYRRKLGVNLHALPVITDLVQEVERLRAELRFLRDAL